MKSIKARFLRIQKENPSWGSICCLCEAVKDKNFCPVVIARNFNKLVNKKDYYKSDKKFLLSYMYEITKSSEEYQKQAQVTLRNSEKEVGRG